jgi:NADH:ubiquinone oxidoreductase subunit 4 (subunit M)
MDMNQSLYGLLLLLPLLGGSICIMLPSSRKILAAMCATVCITALAALWIVWNVFTRGPEFEAGAGFTWMRFRLITFLS